jgi:RNA polymerase sigma-70 factor, ECF subfamily
MDCPDQASSDVLIQHRQYLYRYALSKLRDRCAAEDAVQETLLAAVQGRQRFRGDSAVLTWLTGILKHKIIDWQRREGRNPASPSPRRIDADSEFDEAADTLFDSEGSWVNPPSEWANPADAFENAKFREVLEACLAEVPVQSARAFYLREIEGMETSEICAEMGISESNCWVLLHRARLCLREKLEQRWFGRDTTQAGARGKRKSDGMLTGSGAR